jgi:hypothetical protein
MQYSSCTGPCFLLMAAACGSVTAPSSSEPPGDGGGIDAPSDALVTIAPPGHDFGSVGIGSASAAWSFTITNTGTANAVLNAIKLDGIDAAAFVAITSTCGLTLAPATSCTVGVTLVPDREGSFAAALAVTGPDGALASASLAGAGVATTLSITPSVDSFGQVRLDTVADHSFTIRNTGGVTIEKPVPVLGGAAYTLGATDCTGPLAPDAACALTVRFRPTTLGAQPTTLDVTAGAAAANAQLTGTGAADFAVMRTGPGTITGLGINCGVDCTETVTSSPVMLSAVVPAGARFTGWSGTAAACGTAPSCAVPIASGVVSVAGVFADIPTLTLTVNNSDPPGPSLGLGSVTVSPINQTCSGNVTTGGDATCSYDLLQPGVTLTVTNDCSSFSGWTGACAGQGMTCTLAVTADMVTQANFTFVTCQ